MAQSKEIANFFWHGNGMTLYEKNCILSFVKNDFQVNLWSFETINLPGVIFCNASKFFNISDVGSITQNNKSGCIAAFSDLFRYSVLKDVGGWWFDTDCICLKNQLDFKKLKENKNIIAGFEEPEIINGAVLSFSNQDLANAAYSLVNQILEEKNNIISWGEIGPRLITRLVNEKNLKSEIQQTEAFYPVHWKYALDALDPTKTSDINQRCKNSFVYHYWNEIIKKKNIDKSRNPPVGSFIYNKFYV